VVDSTESTNALASEILVSRTLPEGSVILARHQTAGRGQQGTTWWSERDSSLTMSLVLRPRLPSQLVFALNMAVATGVCDFMDQTLGRKAAIKWPNDITCDELKICGLLIENAIAANVVRLSIVGVGINVNHTSFPEFIPGATSLRRLTGATYNVEALVKPLVESIGNSYHLLQRDPAIVRGRYNDRLFGLGTPQRFSKSGKSFMATIVGVGEDGRLELEVAGERQAYGVKEVSLVPAPAA
jgi:BirA family biotin operon repressor/biotin-[acetyl-CoA-carboxylase] ligase